MPNSTLQKIQRASLRVLIPLNSEDVYKTCVKEAIALSGAKYGSLFLEKNNVLVRVHSTVPLSLQLVPRKDGNTYQAFSQGKLRFVTKKTFSKTHPGSQTKFETMILIPLTYRDKRVGILTLQSHANKKYDLELKHSLKLFGSLATLAIRNIDLYESSQAALKDRELFMSTAAHELKTPLTSIHVFGQLAQKKLNEKKEIDSKWIDSIVANSHSLQQLINDLFSLSQMSMGVFTYRFSPTDIIDTLTKVIDNNRVSHKRKIHFTNELPTKKNIVFADPDKLQIVFNNIIGNAVKYSDRITSISVSIKQKDEMYIISVKDRGRGIDEKDLPHIFDQFYQGRHKKSQGLGLGMYLCKQIIDAHHGVIRITSLEETGTTVRIYLARK